MTERIFKQTDRDLWLYPKLLLVAVGCLALTTILNRWLSDSSAVIFGFLPLMALFTFMGRPVTYRQWLIRIVLVLPYLVAFFLVLRFARSHVSLTWNFPTAVVGIIGGFLLFGFSLTRRWVSWCKDKPFLIPYLVLFVAFWAIMGGLHQLLTMLIGK